MASPPKDMVEKKKVPDRADIPAQYKWNLEKMYENDTLWEKDVNILLKQVEEMRTFSGKLGDSADMLFRALKLRDAISRRLENIYVYARMRRDEDNRNAFYQEKSDQAQVLAVQVRGSLSFVVPEIIEIPEEKIKRFLAENEDLREYDFFFKELFRQKEHILSKREEQILAEIGEIAAAPQNIFGMLNNADIKFPVIRDESGEEIEVTKGRYIRLMESPDRRVRRDAFKALYHSYENQINTIGATLSYSVKKDVFFAKIRKYRSSLEAALSEDNIPVSVYDNLIEAVESRLDAMARYVSLRKRALKVDALHMYDLYVPIVPEVKIEVPYEEAKKRIKEGLRPLGEEYIRIMDKGFHEGWIDVYENQGKTGGAYSFGTYDSSPYILMNYQNTINDLFTLAHEMGHSMHSYYSHQNQPYIYGGYTIFVAEVASTVNETLLMEYLLNNTQDRKEKMYLLNHYLEQFRATVYRQTMFASFEKKIHEKVEKGEALTAENLSQIYLELNKKYYGSEMVYDDQIRFEWARIPHFYNAFYVYKYATGYSAAIALSQQILREGSEAVKRYIDFLKSGSSDYPIHLLQKAGVDMKTPEPIHRALDVFEGLVEKLENMLQV